MTNAELAERQAEVTAAENGRKRDTAALFAATEVAYRVGDYRGCDTLLTEGWDDIWEGLAYPAEVARQRREWQYRVGLAQAEVIDDWVAEVAAPLPWAPAPTRPAVDLHCPDCRRECATVTGHLAAYPECRGAVAALGYATVGGSIGTDYPLARHTPYATEVAPSTQPDPAYPASGAASGATQSTSENRIPRQPQPQPRRRQPRNPGRQGAML